VHGIHSSPSAVREKPTAAARARPTRESTLLADQEPRWSHPAPVVLDLSGGACDSRCFQFAESRSHSPRVAASAGWKLAPNPLQALWHSQPQLACQRAPLSCPLAQASPQNIKASMLNDLPACTRVVAARAGAVQCTSRPWRRGGYACNGSCSWPASRRSTPASNARRPNGQRATDFRKLYRDRMLLLSPIVGCQADLFRSRRNAEPSCMHRPGARRLRAAKRYPPTVMTPAPISAASLRLQDPPQPGLRCISRFPAKQLAGATPKAPPPAASSPASRLPSSPDGGGRVS